tara:strand:- start:262 stop:1125 length:864 start_codon:yes stop_codon:yes gene_type:complete
MNNTLTIVYSAYQSHNLLNKVIRKLPKKYKILIIENSLDKNLKNTLEKKYKNVEVIIPEKNLGLAKSYNLGLKKAKTKFVFLNNPDHSFNEDAIKKLIECANKIKNFGIISPTYRKEKNFKNYEIYNEKINLNHGIYKKYGIVEVDAIDNCFFVNKRLIKNYSFDEKFFLYFETFDFCKNLIDNNKKLFVCNKIKYHHPGSKSSSKKYQNIVSLTRAFHYNWSKFYYLKKHFGILFAYRKITPNFLKSLKKILASIFKFNKSGLIEGFVELSGVITAILSLKSFYRP